MRDRQFSHHGQRETRVESGGQARQAVGHLVSGNYFSVLGADPILGRPITPDDTEAAGGRHVAVISYRYWQQELLADQGAIGQEITVNGTRSR